jgi:hypothetical protein
MAKFIDFNAPAPQRRGGGGGGAPVGVVPRTFNIIGDFFEGVTTNKERKKFYEDEKLRIEKQRSIQLAGIMNEYDEANKDALDVDARKAYMDSISKGLSGDPDASPEAATAIATYGSKNPGSVDFETIPTGPDTKLGRFAQFASDVLSGGSSGEDFTKDKESSRLWNQEIQDQLDQDRTISETAKQNRETERHNIVDEGIAKTHAAESLLNQEKMLTMAKKSLKKEDITMETVQLQNAFAKRVEQAEQENIPIFSKETVKAFGLEMNSETGAVEVVSPGGKVYKTDMERLQGMIKQIQQFDTNATGHSLRDVLGSLEIGAVNMPSFIRVLSNLHESSKIAGQNLKEGFIDPLKDKWLKDIPKEERTLERLKDVLEAGVGTKSSLQESLDFVNEAILHRDVRDNTDVYIDRLQNLSNRWNLLQVGGTGDTPEQNGYARRIQKVFNNTSGSAKEKWTQAGIQEPESIVALFKQKGGLDFASWDMYRRLTDKSYVDKNGLPLYIDDGMIEIAFAYTTEKEHQVKTVIGGRGVSGMAAPARREWCKMMVINYQKRLREEELALTGKTPQGEVINDLREKINEQAAIIQDIMSKTPTSGGKSKTVIRTPGQRTGKALRGGQQVTPFDKEDTLVPQIIQNILDGYGGGKAEYEQYTDEEIKARKKEEKVPHPVGGFF